MIHLAEIDFARVLATALTGLAIMMVMGCLYKAAATPVSGRADNRCIDYPAAYKAFGWFFWLCTIVTFAGAVFTARGDDVIPATICVLFLLISSVAFCLEGYFVKITWDEDHIFTRSPWRRRRKIPMADIERCDFSQSMQWYRIHTRNHGIIRVNMCSRGIPLFFEALPVPHPDYPAKAPTNRGKGGVEDTAPPRGGIEHPKE